MRLIKLEMSNFRSFARAEIDLNASGVVGIRGLNGAGKSSIFEAIRFALYGPVRGQPVRRDQAPADQRTRVAVTFSYDGGVIEVQRSEDNATISVDGVEQASGELPLLRK